MFSAPIVLVALLAAVKFISVVVVGNSAVSNYRDGDAEALGRDTSILHALNVIEPAKAYFADGTLAVLRGRLDEADAHFSKALSLTDPGQTCPILVNLELVRERQGDIDGWEGRRDQARDRYRSALAIVAGAPRDCFENNADPDPERRAVRNDAAARLAAKLAGLNVAPPPAPPRPAPAPPPPPSAPPPVAGASDPEGQRGELRLDPGAGNPMDKLR